MIVVSWLIHGYAPDMVRARYVRAPGKHPLFDKYYLVELGYVGRSESLYEIRRVFCDADDLPPEVKAKADAVAGEPFCYVRWPLVDGREHAEFPRGGNG